MVRLIASLIGLGFVFVLGLALFFTASEAISNPPAETAEHKYHEHPRNAGLSSAGLFGHFDRRQLQRGLQVYKEVCAACHGMKYVSFRDLADLGYSEGQIKTIANDWPIEQPTINPETGEAATRKNVPSDRFPSPYPNEIAARAANGGAQPPDLSLITKARHDGSNYVYSLVGHGYVPQPAELVREFPDAKTPAGKYFNKYYANLNIAMPPPLASEGQVQYADGTRPTVSRMAQDVAAFLTWTAEPRLETRHAAGLASMIFIAIFCFLAWGAYRNVWRDVKH